MVKGHQAFPINQYKRGCRTHAVRVEIPLADRDRHAGKIRIIPTEQVLYMLKLLPRCGYFLSLFVKIAITSRGTDEHKSAPAKQVSDPRQYSALPTRVCAIVRPEEK